jgi:predicted peptidase
MKFNLKYLLFLLLPFLSQAQEKSRIQERSKSRKTISYVFDFPQNAKGNVPLIVFLHGSGERGK